MFNFPWSNFHELNLDWILSVVKEAKEVFDDGRSDIDYAVSTADEAKEIATQAAESSIPDNSVSTSKIQDYAVTRDKISNYSITASKFQNGCVENAAIADSAVTTPKIANSAVTTAKIADGAISKAKLNTELTNIVNSLTDLRTVPGGENVTINNGGFLHIGRVVVVSLSVTLSASITTSTAIATSFPQPIFGDMPLLLTSSDRSVNNACRFFGTSIYPNVALNAGTYYITGAYIANS